LPIEQIANRSFLEENPEAARAFVAATLEGVKFATEHPKEAREIFIKRFPEAKDPIEYYEVIIPTFCGREHDEKGLGYYDAEPWKQLIDVAVDGGVVEQAPELSEVVTDDYLPETTIKSSACG
jgi:ABC-type nitrate/sulfonate/bicarbonate transport system substrate-binding protein